MMSQQHLHTDTIRQQRPAASLRCKLRLLSCTQAIVLVVLQALVALTRMSTEGQPRMQLLTSCALWFR